MHRVDPNHDANEQFAVLRALLDEGKAQAIGLSEVTVDQIKAAQEIVPVATVQNLYNLTNRKSEDVLNYCEEQGIGFIPWYPVASGELARPGGEMDSLAARAGISVAQLSLAWLLQRSPVMMPIPGTTSIAHLEENYASSSITLSDEIFSEASALAL